MGRTQQGNNNAYCQDNDLSWVDWERGAKQADLLEFTCRLSELRRGHPVFRRRRFFSGHSAAAPARGGGDGMLDIAWLTPSGQEMTDGDWGAGYAWSLAVFLNGSAITEPDPHGEAVRDDDFLLLVNAHSEPVDFAMPGARFAAAWEVLVDTSAAAGSAPGEDGAGEDDVPGQAGVPGQDGGPGQNGMFSQARTSSGAPAGGRVLVAGRAMMVLRGSRPAARGG
jgi:glycogen operon protein